MRIQIRPVTESDAAATAALLNSIIALGTLTAMDRPLSTAEQSAYLQDFPERGAFNVALQEETGALLGLQSVEPVPGASRALRHVCEISTFVSLQAQGLGIGRTLSHALFRQLPGLGYEKVVATIRADNPRAIAFYNRLGFRTVGTLERHLRIRDLYVDQVIAEKLLQFGT